MYGNINNYLQLIASIVRTKLYNKKQHCEIYSSSEYLNSKVVGDYLVYYPSSTINAMEMPIGSHEATTPGIIMYVPMEDEIIDSSFEIQYKFHRVIVADPMFWISFVGFLLWCIVLVIFIITYFQIRKLLVH